MNETIRIDEQPVTKDELVEYELSQEETKRILLTHLLWSGALFLLALVL